MTQPNKESATQSTHLESPENNFCVIVCNYQTLDALQLHHKAHTRIQASWNNNHQQTASFIVA